MGPAEVRDRLKTLVNPGENSVCVTGVRVVAGGVLVETRTKEELEFFRSSEAIREGGLTVAVPEAPRVKVAVVAVPAEETEAAVLTALRVQSLPGMSEDEFRAAVRLARRIGARGTSLRGSVWVLEATPRVATAMVRNGRVLLGWNSCIVRDFVEADRCFRCLGFGHSAASCRKRTVTCGWCAGDGHMAAGCPARAVAPCCASCREFGLRAAHAALDSSCPVYQEALAQERAAVMEERARLGTPSERESEAENG